MFPENDSLDADLDMDMANARAMKIFEDRDQGDNIVMPIPEADAESENELDCVGMLEGWLRDANIVEEEGDDFLQNRGGIEIKFVPTPPEQFSNSDVSSQYLFPYARPLPSNEIYHCSSAGTSTPVRPPKEQDTSSRRAHQAAPS